VGAIFGLTFPHDRGALRDLVARALPPFHRVAFLLSQGKGGDPAGQWYRAIREVKSAEGLREAAQVSLKKSKSEAKTVILSIIYGLLSRGSIESY
jgi:hypothetical protein